MSDASNAAAPPRTLKLAFMALWWTLGVALFVWSVETVHGALGAGRASSHHVALLGAVEAVAAILFLVPRTMRIGAAGLLLTFAAALLLHVLEHHFRGDLLVYAAAVLYVATHGPLPIGRGRR